MSLEVYRFMKIAQEEYQEKQNLMKPKNQSVIKMGKYAYKYSKKHVSHL